MSRVVALLLIGFLLLSLIGPLLRLLGIEVVSVDVAAVIVLHVSITDRRPIFGQVQGVFAGGLEGSGVAVALVLGYLSDVLGGGTKGIHGLALAVLYLVGRGLSRHVSLVGGVSQSLVSFGASLLASLVALVLRWLTGIAPGTEIVVAILGQAALTAAIAPLLMRLLQAVEHKLSRDAGDRGTLRLG